MKPEAEKTRKWQCKKPCQHEWVRNPVDLGKVLNTRYFLYKATESRWPCDETVKTENSRQQALHEMMMMMNMRVKYMVTSPHKRKFLKYTAEMTPIHFSLFTFLRQNAKSKLFKIINLIFNYLGIFLPPLNVWNITDAV